MDFSLPPVEKVTKMNSLAYYDSITAKDIAEYIVTRYINMSIYEDMTVKDVALHTVAVIERGFLSVIAIYVLLFILYFYIQLLRGVAFGLWHILD